MALHWSVEDVANYEEVCFLIAGPEDVGRGVKEGDKFLNGITRSLTFATIPVGISRITKANVNDFYSRLSAWEKLYGAACFKDGEDYFITREDIAKHVGLSTNASSKTSNEFWRDLGTIWERDTRG